MTWRPETRFETASATIDVEGKHLVRVDLPLKTDADAGSATKGVGQPID